MRPAAHPVVRALAISLAAGLAAALTSGAGAAQQLRSAPSPAQDDTSTGAVLAAWIGLDAPPGDAGRAMAAIRRRDPRWAADQQGNLVLRTGTGRPRRVVACGVDHSGFVVSAITSAGYLRLHRAGNAPVHPLWDQAHEGQQVAVRTASGDVPGVVAVQNNHFSRQHRGDTAVVGVDQLWVDVGAGTRAEAEAMGIALLDPVRRDLPAWRFADYVTGADASGRAACAAVAGAARAATTTVTRGRGETVFVISDLRSFRWSGLGGALARLGPVDELVLAMPAGVSVSGARDASATAGTAPTVAGPIERRRVAPGRAFPSLIGPDSITTLAVRARFAGTLVESVRATDADSLLAAVATASGVAPARARWLTLDAPTAAARALGIVPVRPAPFDPGSSLRPDSLTAVAELLRTLVELPGVSGHEERVRDAVRTALPAWARTQATVDAAGNLVVTAGPARDTTVVIAHLDEVGYVVAAVRGDGRVTLAARGGMVASAWEGQLALLHLDLDAAGGRAPSVLPGVFVPRDSASVRTASGPPSAWFGLDSAALVARGVRVGQGVTAFKRGQRLGATRFTARALDDRAGSTALLLALRALDPTQLDHTVIFAWSTREETGTEGAAALAQRLGATVRRVYAVDTFVSSDTPLELPTFAYVPLGGGPVLRGLDDGSMSTREERDRVQRAARAAGVTLQVGTTHGATDATPFAAWGAVGAGLSWPGRYSHSPAEVLDLRDLNALARLIVAAASGSTR